MKVRRDEEGSWHIDADTIEDAMKLISTLDVTVECRDCKDYCIIQEDIWGICINEMLEHDKVLPGWTGCPAFTEKAVVQTTHPGTTKTEIIKQAAEEMGYPVIRLDDKGWRHTETNYCGNCTHWEDGFCFAYHGEKNWTDIAPTGCYDEDSATPAANRTALLSKLVSLGDFPPADISTYELEQRLKYLSGLITLTEDEKYDILGAIVGIRTGLTIIESIMFAKENK